MIVPERIGAGCEDTQSSSSFATPSWYSLAFPGLKSDERPRPTVPRPQVPLLCGTLCHVSRDPHQRRATGAVRRGRAPAGVRRGSVT